ncbi:MAG: hypothetical protein KAW09_09895 [Thermoplasmata archaeon]|nr:hypothetical protein [Thermoplasmata archaeon]
MPEGEKESKEITMRAKFAGTCPKCEVGIFPGQLITKDGEEWIHSRCADDGSPKKPLEICKCGHSKTGHVKNVCMADGCWCKSYSMKEERKK